jgi:murein DD-endopeptidase MepM/ murein hydrolase activator NlpD
LGLLAPSPQLAVGSQGDAVRAVQQQLGTAGVRVPGGADGVYGQATAKAVGQYQSERSLPVTGSVDALTAALLAAGAPVVASSPAVPASGATGGASGLPAPGASGAAVTALQRQLIAVGARPKGGADGVYGPSTVAAVKVFQRWMGITASGVLDQATADALTSAAGTAVAPRLASFPVPSTCLFWDTWGAPRSGGRIHQGVDIFAKRGTPVYAVATGRITLQRADFPGSIGGNQQWLTATDGSRYFYGHLSGFAKGVGLGSPVRAGDVIGYAGSTGLSTVTHLHFEIHPGGGAPVNPYPVLKAMAGC